MITVLLPVDGSEGSARAVQMVIALYRRLAPVGIRLLHVEIADSVADDALGVAPAGGGAGGPAGAPAPAQRALASAQALLDHAGVPYSSDVRKGYVPPMIVEYARATHCDAIVMGTRGMGASGEILGSIARQVVSLSDVPVTLVK